MNRRLACAVSVLIAGGLTACGGDDTSSQTTTTRVEVVRTARAVDGSAAVRGAFDAEQIYAQEGPGVVTVISTGFGGRAGEDAGLGSGFVISAGGEIATNAHVVTSGEGASIKPAGKVYIRFQDGNQVSARIVGFDPFSDVALLRIDPKGLRLRVLPLGSTRDVAVGAPVAAIGSPYGEEQSLSVGIVSATNRSIASLTGFQTTGAIQTDAAINHGNSGGPLLDAEGRVLGINSQIRSESGEGSGVGFAVPADVVKRSLDQLRTSGRARYAFLGVSSRELYPQLARRFDLPTKSGVWVQDVVRGGPADRAGVKAGTDREEFQVQDWVVGGDVIVGLDGNTVDGDDDLSRLLLPHKPGDTITLKLFHGKDLKQITVTLGERPLSRPRG